MLSPRIRLIAVFIAASALTPQASSGFLHTGDTAAGDVQQATSTDKLIKSLDTVVEEGHDAQGEIAHADTDDTETEASSANNEQVEDDEDGESDNVDTDSSAEADDGESAPSNSADDDAASSDPSDSTATQNELLQQAGSWENFLQVDSVDATAGSEGDDDAVETGDQELDAVLKDGAEAALPDENLDADDAKIVYGSSENEEQLVEDLEAQSDDSEDSEAESTNSGDSEAGSLLQTKATAGAKGDDDAVENGDQELDAILKDGADAAIPDENLDADDAKIVYGSSENEEQLVEDLEGESDDADAE